MGIAQSVRSLWRSMFSKQSTIDPQASGTTSASGTEPATSATSATPASSGRTLLIHGYSATGEDLKPWKDRLAQSGILPVSIDVGNYITLNNEVTLKDLGEAFDRALRLSKWSSGSKDDDWTFDAIVHSTGILVLRQWLASDPFLGKDDTRSRIRRLKHLVGLAPATFGSPQAKQGRSWLGALVKGNKHLGPDFLNAGNQVLAGLELGSKFTWDLAHQDMVCDKPLYDSGPNTPYVTVFIGNTPYDGVAAVSNSPGADGTVRWAGCALNTRKVSLDFRREPKLTDNAGQSTRCCITPWVTNRQAAPMIAVSDKNHGTIVSEPDDDVAGLITSFFFQVVDKTSYEKWETEALTFGSRAIPKMNAASKDGSFGGAGWQQLVVHMVDDHGDGVTDFNLQLFIGDSLSQSDDPAFPSIPLIVDSYSGDSSYRCFYIRLSDAMLSINKPGGEQKKLWIELIASSGSTLIEYEAYTGLDGIPQRMAIDHVGGKPVKLDITALAQGDQSLLYPYTTTLLEIFVEREPLPLGAVSELFRFLGES